MAEALFLDVARQLDVAMSRRRLHLEQLGCLDRLVDLHIEPSSIGCIADTGAIHDIQLPFKLGTLLGRVLDQHNDPRAGWQDVNYCLLVHKVAAALFGLLNASDRSVWAGSCNQGPVIAQQLAASGLMPKLVEALPGLATAVEAATEPHTCLPAALGVLMVVFCILYVWPGQTGVLSSKAAGPLVQPTLHLIVALLQRIVVTNDASAFEVVANNLISGIPVLAQQVLVQTNRVKKDQLQKGQQKPQAHPYLEGILSSPTFLTVLLTVTCMILHPGSAAPAVSNAYPDRAATVATDPASSSEQHDRGGCRTRRGAESGHAGAAGVSALDVAELQQADLQMQLALVLQDLYGQSDTSSTWHRLLSGSADVTHAGYFCHDELQEVLRAAAECIQQVIIQLQRAVACVNEQRPTCLTLPHQQLLCLHALDELPVLLLGPLCSAPAQTAACRNVSAYGVHRAALGLIEEVIQCWKVQLELQSTCVGVQLEQLPCTELLRLLQQMKVLQQLRSEATAAPAPAQSTADGASSNLGSRTTAADTASATAVEAKGVRQLDLAMVRLLDVLTLLQQITDYAVWQPHLRQVAAAVERCFRSTSSSTNDAATALLEDGWWHNLCAVCNSFLYLELQSFQLADSEGPSEVIEPSALLRAAAAAAPSSHQQQQLFTLLISLLKGSSYFQQSGSAARVLEYPLVTVSKIVNRVFPHMVDTLCSDLSAADELLHGMPRGKVLCAAAPWLVVSSRLVCHVTTQLTKALELLEEQLHETAAIASYSSSGGNISSSNGAQSEPGTDAAEQVEGDRLRRVLYCNESVVFSVAIWVHALEKCCSLLRTSTESTDRGHNSADTDTDAIAACDVDTSVTAPTPPAIAASAQMALAAVHDAVQDLQQAQLQEACRVLQSELGSARLKLWETGFTELQGVCYAACPEWQQEVEAGQHMPWGVSASRAVFDVDLFNHVLEQHHLKQLLQTLTDVGQSVCAALPLKSCCNNPVCRNVSGNSEWVLVSGKGCVCSGCETARYCSRECQVAHWPRHKAICKAIKKQSRPKQQA